MLALITFLVVWAATAWRLVDGDAINIACGTSHVYLLLRGFIGTASRAVDHEHPVVVEQGLNP